LLVERAAKVEDQPLRNVQDEVQRWADSYWDGQYWPPLANLARLTEEVGEVARVVNQVHGPKRIKASEVAADLKLEFGDLVFVLTALANSLGVDLQAGFDEALEKYRVRDETGPASG
jgi:NTP pyrophosphatase (non-canonical NTP hydrolase)